MPSVYYGDEIGLAGGRDPDCRRCMIWNPQLWNMRRREFYQTLMRFRRTSPALRWGGYQLLYAAHDTLAFPREAPEERLLIVAQRKNDGLTALPIRHAGLPDGTRLRDVLTSAEVVITHGMLPLDTLPSIGVQIWREDR